MQRLFMVAALWLVVATGLIPAQTAAQTAAQTSEPVWVQIEAQPTLAQATEAARDYGAQIADVNGFAISSGWYAIVLGPYTRLDADQVLRSYRAQGLIPSDAFIAFSRSFRQQFWPVGANVLAGVAAPLPEPVIPAPPAPAAAPTVTPLAPAADPAPAPTPAPAIVQDETEREARATEAALTESEREALQIALKWAGTYDGAIDGAFGRGTRTAMAAWQDQQGLPATGVLTTRQRAQLLDAYSAVLRGLRLAPVRDAQAGIEVLMPTAVVGFGRYEPPFAQYDATGDIPARVLLISQEGDQATLFGLYDILQTLEIVPADGPRSRDNTSFVLVGEGGDFISHSEARLQNNEVKGFTLIWPAGDEERRRRVLAEMQASFTRLPGALDPDMLTETGQSIDLVAGLEVRKPRQIRSGVFVDDAGAVLTAAEAVAGCTRVTLDNDIAARVAATDAALGLALVRPDRTLAPASMAVFRQGEPRLQSEVAVAGFPYGAVLDRPTLTFGRLADIRSLDGQDDIARLDLETLPGDLGGPVFDATGAVLGILTPVPAGGRILPANVAYATDAAAVTRFLSASGITARTSGGGAQMAAEDLARAAETMTVMVSCWDE